MIVDLVDIYFQSPLLENLEGMRGCGFDVSLQISDPTQQPELLELHRLVVTPSLVKLQP